MSESQLFADGTSIILISTGILIPIAASCLRSYVLPKYLASRFNAYFNYPPAVGSHHSVPIFNLMTMPTRGQSLFLFYLVAINIIFCSVGYKSRQPNSWYASSTEEIRSFVANRTGALSLVNIALSVLYAGRNNVLISLTDWSHTTFLLLHRWVASIATLQACIHSAIYLYNYMASGEHATEAKLDYWIWGVVATLGMAFLLPTSVLPIRQKFYELFLVWHVVLSFFVILGSYLHILLRFQKQWGYELWMYIAFAFWGFDRVYRLVRLARNGVCKAQITIIDEDYIRLDVPGITGEGQAYLYFPTLTWRVWENHPFSIAGGMLQENTSDSVVNQKTSVSSSASSANNSPTSSSDIEKAPNLAIRPVIKPNTPTSIPKLGLSFIIRTHSGTTSLLRSRSSLPVLVEAPYTGSLLHPTHATLNHHPRLLCIAGGVGVTALLPLLAAHRGSRKLAWGVRQASLIEGLRDLTESNAMAGVTIETTVGRRMDVRALVEQEAACTDGSLAVVVSGPPGMADEVRTAVAAVAGRSCEVEFVEESYSW
jgi:NAD(P)H-flavin reductase